MINSEAISVSWHNHSCITITRYRTKTAEEGCRKAALDGVMHGFESENKKCETRIRDTEERD